MPIVYLARVIYMQAPIGASPTQGDGGSRTGPVLLPSFVEVEALDAEELPNLQKALGGIVGRIAGKATSGLITPPTTRAVKVDDYAQELLAAVIEEFPGRRAWVDTPAARFVYVPERKNNG